MKGATAWNGIRILVLTFGALLLLCAPGPAQAQEGTWARHYGGASTDRFYCMDRTTDGGTIVAGATYTYGMGPANLWVLKMDSFGRPEWQRVYPTAQISLPYSVKQTYEGGYILTAELTTVGQAVSSAVLMKLDASGAITWRKVYSQATTVALRSAVDTSDGGLVAAGFLKDPATQKYAPWLLKVDGTGATQWHLSFPAALDGFGRGVVPAWEGGYLLCSQSEIGGQAENFQLIHVDSTGSPIWQKSYGGTLGEYWPVLRRSIDRGYFLAGVTETFGAGDRDGWVLKVDHEGEILWQRAVGTGGWEQFDDVQAMPDGGCILSGYRDPASAGGGSGWLVRFDASGNAVWQRTAGGAGYGELQSLVPDYGGGITAAGSTVAWGSGGDAWALRMTADGTMDPGCALLSDQADPVVPTGAQPQENYTTVAPPTVSVTEGTIVPQETPGAYDLLCAAPCSLKCAVAVSPNSTVGMPTQFNSTVEPLNCDGSPSLKWDFGDGTTSTEPYPLHTYGGPGAYAWSFTATLGAATCTEQGNISVGAAPPPTAATWAHHYGTAATERAPGGIRKLAGDGYLIGGTTYPPGSTLTDLLLLKTDEYGAMTGQWSFEGMGWDEPGEIVPTADGGALVAGSTKSEGAGSYDAWLLKLDGTGTCLWQKTFGAIGYDRFLSMAPTADGGTIAAGTRIPIDPAVYQAWVVKLDASGAVQWQRTYGSFAAEYGSSVIQASDGTFLLAGETRSYGAGETDLWILHLDPAGEILWQYAFGTPGIESSPILRESAPGNYLVAALTRPYGWAPFDGLLLNIDGSGSLLWAKTVGGLGSDTLDTFEVLPGGGALLGGGTQPRFTGGALGWLVRLDPSWNPLWQRSLGDVGYDDLQGMVPTADGGVTVAGNTTEYGVDVWALHLDGEGNMDASCPSLRVPATGIHHAVLARTATTAEAIPTTAGSSVASLPQFPYGGTDGTICAASCTLECSATVPSSANAGTPVSFAAAAETTCPGTVLYSWTFGDGATSTEQAPSHAFTAAGSYDWQVTVSAEGVTCTRGGTILIAAPAIPGDCTGDGTVSIGEVQRAINMFLGLEPAACGVDCSGDGTVSIGEVQKVINAFLGLSSSC